RAAKSYRGSKQKDAAPARLPGRAPPTVSRAESRIRARPDRPWRSRYVPPYGLPIDAQNVLSAGKVREPARYRPPDRAVIHAPRVPPQIQTGSAGSALGAGRHGGVGLTLASGLFTLKAVEVHIPPKQEAQLGELAARTGRGTDDLIQEAIDRLLAYNQWFHEQVQAGLDQLDRGEYIEEDAMDARVQRMMKP